MFITHRFAHSETLDRARYWLTELGFRPSQMEVHATGVPHISLRAPLSEIAEAELLFAALESSDPTGRPGFWDTLPHSDRVGSFGQRAEEAAGRARSAVGWHPMDDDLRADPQLRALREVMGH
jgi:hypothetical protein